MQGDIYRIIFCILVVVVILYFINDGINKKTEEDDKKDIYKLPERKPSRDNPIDPYKKFEEKNELSIDDILKKQQSEILSPDYAFDAKARVDVEGSNEAISDVFYSSGIDNKTSDWMQEQFSIGDNKFIHPTGYNKLGSIRPKDSQGNFIPMVRAVQEFPGIGKNTHIELEKNNVKDKIQDYPSHREGTKNKTVDFGGSIHEEIYGNQNSSNWTTENLMNISDGSGSLQFGSAFSEGLRIRRSLRK